MASELREYTPHASDRFARCDYCQYVFRFDHSGNGADVPSECPGCGYHASLALLTPEAAAVLDRACKLQAMADATGVDMDVDLFAASWGSFSRAVRAYQETRGSDAD